MKKGKFEKRLKKALEEEYKAEVIGIDSVSIEVQERFPGFNISVMVYYNKDSKVISATVNTPCFGTVEPTNFSNWLLCNVYTTIVNERLIR